MRKFLALLVFAFFLIGCNSATNKKLLFLEVTSVKTVFFAGENVKDSLRVKSFYSDGSEKILASESYSTDLENDIVTAATDSVTVTYSEKSVTKTKDVSIVVKTGKELVYLDAISKVNVFFDEDGPQLKDLLVVKGIYSDGSEKILENDDYSLSFISGGDSLDIDSLRVSYTENNVTKTKDIPFVKGRLSDYMLTFLEWLDFADTAGVRPCVYSVKFVREKPRELEDTELYGISRHEEHRKLDCYIYMNKNLNEMCICVVGDRIVLPANSEKFFQLFSDIEELDLRNVDVSYVTNMNSMFMGCTKLTSINFGDFKTSNVTTMEYMFANCEEFRHLDLSCFDTYKVTSMKDMFSCCFKLLSLNLSSFDVTNHPSMTDMFDGCGQTGTTVTINPKFWSDFAGAGLNSGWEHVDGSGVYVKQ